MTICMMMFFSKLSLVRLISLVRELGTDNGKLWTYASRLVRTDNHTQNATPLSPGRTGVQIGIPEPTGHSASISRSPYRILLSPS